MVLLIGAVVAIVVLIVVVAIWATRRSEPDTLGTFQRQIDALSPQARRQVVDQVQRLERPDEDEPEDRGGATDGS